MKRRIAEFLRGRRRVAVISHADPDGDAVGAALGLATLLEGAGVRADAVLPGGVPRLYSFVPGAERVLASPSPALAEADAFVVIDATAPSRLGGLEGALLPGVPVVNIDHHPDNTRFGDLCWVDASACAAALLVLELAEDAGWRISVDAAACLYVGIVTDTGRFTFANADARALSAAARLAELGASPHAIASRVYERASAASLRLLARALATLDVADGGRVASIHVTRDMLAETGASPEDADGFSAYPRFIEGVRVGLFFREAEGGTVKVSFRSNEGVDIHGVAGRFGGGGHARASGARVPGPIEAAKENVVGAVSEHLRTLGG
jgi:phosphoesterase RecJ-like protein